MNQEYMGSSYTQSRYTPKQKEMVREQMAQFEERPLDPNAVPTRRRGKARKDKGLKMTLRIFDVWLAFEYDMRTGLFKPLVHQVNAFDGIDVLTVPVTVGRVDSDGYVIIPFRGKRYPAHRLAWRMVTGDWPERRVRHLNGLRFDNRWDNLALSIGKPNGAENSD